jgi:hypothetical protein
VVTQDSDGAQYNHQYKTAFTTRSLLPHHGHRTRDFPLDRYLKSTSNPYTTYSLGFQNSSYDICKALHRA